MCGAIVRGLLGNQPNAINKLKSNKVATRSSILAASKAAAATATRDAVTGAPKVEPEITTNDDARDEADRVNMFRLAAIGAKEGVAAGIVLSLAAPSPTTLFERRTVKISVPSTNFNSATS